MEGRQYRSGSSMLLRTRPDMLVSVHWGSLSSKIENSPQSTWFRYAVSSLDTIE